MARTLDEIKQQITSKYVSEMAAIGYTINPTNFSATNLQKLWIYVVAFCIFIHENLFDTFKKEVDNTIAEMKPHTRNWYKNKVLAFQFGYDLPVDNDVYDNSNLSDTDIAESKVVAYCAVTDKADILTIKIAKNSGSDLEPLNNTELAALQGYMHKVKDAGVFLAFVNEVADSLLLNANIYYNPMLIDENGVNISSGEDTVKNAIKNYLKNLPFNGEFALQTLQDVLQKVEGVVYVEINSVQVKATVSSAYQTVEVYYLPASGYLRFIDETSDLNLTFIPYAN